MLLALPFLLLLPTAASAGADQAAPVKTESVQTGRSVAVTKTPPDYWLSRDLNRLFFQPQPSAGAEGETRTK